MAEQRIKKQKNSQNVLQKDDDKKSNVIENCDI
jgi:hypothetical protein